VNGSKIYFYILTNLSGQVIVKTADLWSDHFATVIILLLKRMSSMTSLFRPLLSSLLCCVIAIGQLSALLHVAGFHGHSHGTKAESAQASFRIGNHGCQYHVAAHSEQRGVELNLIDHEDPGHVPEHDSDQCAICQSLLNPVGLVWDFELPLVHGGLSEPASICADRLPVEAAIAIPQPRGPPFAA
jgi:hypothetical protein